ncbi:hypothetical protein ElyMa_005705800 [Elysia marginata]|uniref:Endonuclease/exonuclease/phosphatase domain-containing protein n=1 Tax=Elysia marginata TaxID=1093978 RepID=A0AAV4FHB2_9GAST|nr:hypothetical protein ElyMa_005705800 [Elysia marginata]
MNISDKALSDHFVITFSLDLPKPSEERRTRTTKDIRLIDKQIFKETLSATLSSCPPDADGETQAELYISNLEEALNHHAPARTRNITTRPSAPWYTLEIKQAKQERRTAERKWNKPKLTLDKQIYTLHVNAVKELILSEKKKKCLGEKIVNCKTSKALCDITKELKGKKGTFSSYPIVKTTKQFRRVLCQ